MERLWKTGSVEGVSLVPFETALERSVLRIVCNGPVPRTRTRRPVQLCIDRYGDMEEAVRQARSELYKSEVLTWNDTVALKDLAEQVRLSMHQGVEDGWPGSASATIKESTDSMILLMIYRALRKTIKLCFNWYVKSSAF